jgi:hypothetical protein
MRPKPVGGYLVLRIDVALLPKNTRDGKAASGDAAQPIRALFRATSKDQFDPHLHCSIAGAAGDNTERGDIVYGCSWAAPGR